MRKPYTKESTISHINSLLKWLILQMSYYEAATYMGSYDTVPRLLFVPEATCTAREGVEV